MASRPLGTAPVTRAECDGKDWLIRAEEPLAGLQRACGGELPGMVAVPELLELVREVRVTRRCITRQITAQAADRPVRAWVEAEPSGAGCSLTIMEWDTAPLGNREPFCDPVLAAPFVAHREEGRGALLEAEPSVLSAVREPIGRIIANAEAIRDRSAGAVPNSVAAYGNDIATAARHLLAVAERLGQFPASGHNSVADLNLLARDAAKLLAGQAEQRRMTVVAPSGALLARADPQQVRQILLNLLGNALRYAPEGTTVRIVVGGTAERATVTVADEGGRIDADDLDRLFKPFERLGRSAKDGGSGLGLYVARRLARSMGGDLYAASSRGEGTRFSVDLTAA